MSQNLERRGKIFTFKFNLLLILLFFCGIIVSILKYNGVFLSSAEGADFKKRVAASIKSDQSVSFKSLIPGEWSQVCIFVADTSYPESAREGIASFLKEKGLQYSDDQKDFPVIFLLVSDGEYQVVRLNRRYLSLEGKKYVFYYGANSLSERHQGCVDFDDAALTVLNKEKKSLLLLTSVQN